MYQARRRYVQYLLGLDECFGEGTSKWGCGAWPWFGEQEAHNGVLRTRHVPRNGYKHCALLAEIAGLTFQQVARVQPYSDRGVSFRAAT